MGIFIKKGKVANHSDNCEMFTSTAIQENAPTSNFGQRDEVLQQLTRQVTSLPNEFGSSYNSNNWIFSFRNKIPETNRDYVRVGAIQSPKKTNMQKIYNYCKKMMDYIIHSKG